MKVFRLVWTGLWRKKARTIFTMLSIVIAFLLFGMLQGIGTTFKQIGNRGRLNVLVTTNPAGLPLPLADLSKIQAVHGVTGVTYRALFIGHYQSLRNIVVVQAVDAESFLAQNSTYSVSAEARTAFLHSRSGALVSLSLAERLGWKVGDRIPIEALNALKKDGTSTWTFEIVGTFDMPDSLVRQAPLLLTNYSYFDTARAMDSGTVQLYTETIADASQAPAVSNTIDNLFVNSSNRTRTETERENAQGQLAQIGDLDFFVEMIVAAAFATLLLLTGTAVMQAYHERIHEFAVMKTLGFTDGGVCVLVVSEAILLTGGSAVLGLLIAHAMLPALSALMTRSGTPMSLHLPGSVIATGVGFALLLALLSVLPAAWRARRLSIIDALATR
jgi:putative ABC transport system permease protein